MSLLSWQPESKEALKDRFKAALTPVIDTENPPYPPGSTRKHTFDFEETGIRMVASTDLIDGKVYIHLSFSFPHTKLALEIDDREKVARGLAAELIGLKTEAVREITPRAIHYLFVP